MMKTRWLPCIDFVHRVHGTLVFASTFDGFEGGSSLADDAFISMPAALSNRCRTNSKARPCYWPEGTGGINKQCCAQSRADDRVLGFECMQELPRGHPT